MQLDLQAEFQTLKRHFREKNYDALSLTYDKICSGVYEISTLYERDAFPTDGSCDDIFFIAGASACYVGMSCLDVHPSKAILMHLRCVEYLDKISEYGNLEIAFLKSRSYLDLSLIYIIHGDTDKSKCFLDLFDGEIQEIRNIDHKSVALMLNRRTEIEKLVNSV